MRPAHIDTPTPGVQIAELKQRIERASDDTGRLRQIGSHEQYLASYFLVEVLESQLDTLLQAQRARHEERQHA